VSVCEEYRAGVSGVDRTLGRVQATLEKLPLDKQTMVFTSDHGYNMGHNGVEHTPDPVRSEAVLFADGA
jgi:uncharacterized sulfatase